MNTKDFDWEERAKTIAAAPFLSPPLDSHNIGEIRPKLEWEVREIVTLVNEAIQADRAKTRQQLLKAVEEMAYIPELGNNQQWTGSPVKVVNLEQLIDLLKAKDYMEGAAGGTLYPSRKSFDGVPDSLWGKGDL